MHQEFLKALRGSAPYVHAHRGRTFVIGFGGSAAEDDNFSSLLYDIALLNSLGVRVVLVHGARPQIERRLASAGVRPRMVDGVRVTDAAALICVKEAVGALRMEIEALLSTGLASTPMAGARVRVVGGNLVTAKPVGVRSGVDHQHTGEVRRVDAAALQAHLERGHIVLLSPVGYSPTGEIFNLPGEEIATAVAAALRADKLVFLHAGPRLAARELELPQAQQLSQEQGASGHEEAAAYLACAVRAARSGVPRTHLVSFAEDGALLRELYTLDGVGTLVFSDGYDATRFATIDDVGGILALIAPLEQAGVLVARSREQLELEIDHFLVVVRDGTIIACAALIPYPHEDMGEVACVAVHPDYRGQGRAEGLLKRIERRARGQGLKRLYALTTHTPHWFRERGFREASRDELPAARRQRFDTQRNSKVLTKTL